MLQGQTWEERPKRGKREDLLLFLSFSPTLESPSPPSPPSFRPQFAGKETRNFSPQILKFFSRRTFFFFGGLSMCRVPPTIADAATEPRIWRERFRRCIMNWIPPSLHLIPRIGIGREKRERVGPARTSVLLRGRLRPPSSVLRPRPLGKGAKGVDLCPPPSCSSNTSIAARRSIWNAHLSGFSITKVNLRRREVCFILWVGACSCCTLALRFPLST